MTQISLPTAWLRRPRKPLSTVKLGLVMLAFAAVAGFALFHKNQILTALRPGESIKVQFASSAHLTPYFSQAKVAFVPVGVVTGVERLSDGTALVTLKVRKGTSTKLGSAPSATIRPTTLLGGNYFVDLQPGGDRTNFEGTIPTSRTKLPVELDKVANALQPSALKGAQQATAHLDQTLASGAGSALDRLAADAPQTLRPAAGALTALEGENPSTDLTDLVRGLETTARVVTAQQGQLGDVVDQLSVTTGVLSKRADDLASTINQLPATLTSTDGGLQILGTTLDLLRSTANEARPTAKALGTLLNHAQPVLGKAGPVVKQLDAALTDIAPTVQELVPTARDYSSVLNDLGGSVLDRVNGPVLTTLLSPYKGTGSYAGTGSDRPLYQDAGYMLATLDRASSLVDRNGQAIAFQPGIGIGSVGGVPVTPLQMFDVIAKTFHIPTTLTGTK